MTFEQFEAEAHRMWEEIPVEFKSGVDGIVVAREEERHPDHDDYYTLGMCFTETYPSEFDGPDTTRSFLTLYHGSFRKVAEDDPEFSWEDELWETITHELRHHLEHLADDDDLEGLDYALEQTHRREGGLDFDPWFFQAGTELAPHLYRVERDVYIEWAWRAGELEEGGAIEFDWDGRRWSVPAPAPLEDVHFMWMKGIDSGGGWLQLVFVRTPGLWERLRRILGRERPSVGESEMAPKVVGRAPGSPGPDA